MSKTQEVWWRPGGRSPFALDPTKPRLRQIISNINQSLIIFGGPIISMVALKYYPPLIEDRTFAIGWFAGIVFWFLAGFAISANLALSVTYHIAPDKVPEMYNRFGGDRDAAVSRLIQPRVYQEVKVVFGGYTAQKAITERGKLNLDAAKALTDAISYDPVFIIEGVQIEDIAFSPEYIRAVEQRMQAEIQVTQQEQQLRQEKIKAEIAVTQATGRVNSIRAEAQAQADAIVLKGDAEAKAIKARADALSSNANLVALTQAEKWNGQLPTTMVPNGAVPFLNISGRQ